jgi:glutathione S-transferase
MARLGPDRRRARAGSCIRASFDLPQHGGALCHRPAHRASDGTVTAPQRGNANMITLYSFPGSGSLPSASPFCFKLEAYLRLTKVEYRTVYPRFPGKSPKGKLPYVEDGGRLIGDSGFIIEHLKASRGDSLDAGLSAAELATAHAFRRLFEENFYWCMVYARWFDESNWPRAKQEIFGRLPLPVRLIGPFFARRALRRQIAGHGMGRHSQAEIYRTALDDLKSASAFLADKRYFLGERPRAIDATAYPFLALFLTAGMSRPIQSEVDRLTNLRPYCERLHQEAFGRSLG